MFERYLTVWVALGIAVGVGFGWWIPGVFQAVASLEIAHVNLMVAILIWVLIYAMMIQSDSSQRHRKAKRTFSLQCMGATASMHR